MTQSKCPTCGKNQSESGRIGSLTSYLFQGNTCSCHRQVGRGSASSAGAGKDSAAEFCPRCGLEKVSEARAGSLTGYLFQHTKCRCEREASFDATSMSQKFWKLKEKGGITSGGSATSGPSKMEVDLLAGATIGGAYRIVRPIGRGGMGEVYLAEQITMGKNCALKVIPPEQVTEMGWLRFQNEAKIFARLQHPNLVRVFDLGIHDGCLPFYAMDYVDGSNVAELLAKNGPMPLQAAIDIFSQVCDGVDYAHRNGVIHRDIKPANIMMLRSRGDQKPLVKILDFGLAKLVQRDRASQSLTAVGEVFGSPFYMSPEQCSGERIDNRSDIYSVGCTLFECLTGRPPFNGTSPVAIVADHQMSDPPSLENIVGPAVFPDSLEVVMAKLLRKNPAERYQTLAELKGDLERVARGENVQPFYVSRTKVAPLVEDAPESPPPFLAQKVDRGRSARGLWMIGAAASVLVVAALVAKMFFLGGAASQRVSASLPKARLEDPYHSAAGTKGDLNIDSLTPDRPMSLLNWDGKPFFKGLHKQGDLLVREWIFPTDPEGGNYGLFIDTSAKEFGMTAMAGKKTARVGAVVAMEPLVSILKVPGLLKGFTDGNFEELRLKMLNGREFDQIVDGLAQCRSLQHLHVDEQFQMSKTVPDPALLGRIVSAVDRFPHLKELSFYCPIDGAILCKVRRLKELSNLSFSLPLTNASPLCDRLAGSTALRSLELSVDTLDAAQLKKLAQCPRLEELTFIGASGAATAITADHLRALAGAKGLVTLAIGYTSRDPETLAAFAGLKRLRELHLYHCGDWTIDSKAALRNYLPETKLIFHRKGKGGALQVLKP